MVFTNFIFTFGVCQLNFSRDDATALISIFWVTFTVFRALSAIQVYFNIIYEHILILKTGTVSEPENDAMVGVDRFLSVKSIIHVHPA